MYIRIQPRKTEKANALKVAGFGQVESVKGK